MNEIFITLLLNNIIIYLLLRPIKIPITNVFLNEKLKKNTKQFI